ncbi:MAG TPA: hypothetical protein VIV60_22355 [Polyangiaceae bacterium]
MADIFVHVDMIVSSNNCSVFEQRVTDFIKKGNLLAVRPGWELTLALKGTKPFMYTPQGTFDEYSREFDRTPFVAAENGYCHRHLQAGDSTFGPAFRYVHVWRVPSEAYFNLPEMMQGCVDNTDYMRIDELVICEIQDIIRRVKWLDALPKASSAKRFVRIVRQFSYRNLGGYLFDLCGLFPALEAVRWHQLGQFQNVTGSLNSAVEFWQIDDDTPDRPLAKTTLRQAAQEGGGAAVAALVKSIEELSLSEGREMYERASYFGAAPEATQ